MNSIVGDLRLGVRRLVNTPAASLTVLGALSVGIGLCALMFSVIDGALLATLPMPNGERMVRIARADFSPVSTDTYLYWEERQQSFEGLGVATSRSVTLAIEGRATEPVWSAALTMPALELLAVEPMLGRGFAASDSVPGAPAVALIGADIWRSRFDADPGVLGRVVRLSGTPAEIVGVMPEGFGFPMFQSVWTPLRLDAFRPSGNPETHMIFGMLRDGVSPEAAVRELNALDEQRLRSAPEAGQSPPAPRATPVQATPYTNLFNPPGVAQAIAGIMLSVALLVLLVACANVTNVLLARAAVRAREVAVRTALGASRARIASQFWVEVSLLAVGGALGGVLLAQIAVRLVGRAVAAVEGLPFWWVLRVDLSVLAFVSIAAMVVAIAAGVMPAMFAARSNSHELLKDASRATSSLRMARIMRRVIGAEIAVSLVLLVAAGLFIRSAINVQTYEFSFEPGAIFTSVVSLPETRYDDAAAQAELAERLEESLATLPEASSAAIVTALPGVGGAHRPVAVEGVHLPSAPDLPGAAYTTATPGFFATFEAPAITGRLFDSRDRAGSLPVAIVNESFERLHLPQGAIGRRVAIPDRSGEPVWRTVVGVVPDLPGQLGASSVEAVYAPFAQAPERVFQITVRSRTSAAVLPAPIRQAVASVEPDAALSYARPLDEAIGSSAPFGWFSVLFLVAGGAALALAGVGLYGIMAFWVAQRTREIGLRMAIGGGRGPIVGLVMRRGLTPVLFGLGFGMLVAVPVAWLLRGALLEVSAFDPIVFGAVLGVLLCAGVIGCLGPAIRATRIDPQAALSVE